MSPSLTLFFIVEPPTYQYLACYLAASIRNHMPPDVQIVGYCPNHRREELSLATIEALRRMDCEVRFFDAEGRFDPVYPHGNKILACLEPRDTDFSGFLDSDILLIRDNSVAELTATGHVCASPAASLRWAQQDMWPRIYGEFGREVPSRRIRLMRDKRVEVVPYYSSGFVTFPERHRNKDGQSFAQVWYDTAQRIDNIAGLDNRRPYLDQMSLPLAIERSGLEWKEFSPEQHYILGGSIRGKPIPQDQEIKVVHYRKWNVLKEVGLAQQGYEGLARQIGTSRVERVFRAHPPGGAPRGEGGDAKTPPIRGDMDAAAPRSDAPSGPASEADDRTPSIRSMPARKQSPDPSRAGLAAVTMVRGDHVFLERWIDYYAPLAGRENLYVLRHGPDAQIDRIAFGANIINVPLCQDMSGFDRRRWSALSDFASGLTLYYNWVLCNDVDELVAPDPATGLNLTEYLSSLFDRGLAAPVISPFAVEIVHTPDTELEPIVAGQPILAVRRNFRINSNYAKPCLIRRRVRFSVGGHGSNIKDVRLDPQLWLFHLRYMDDKISTDRLLARRQFVTEKAGDSSESSLSKSTWAQGTTSFERLRIMRPVGEQAEFPDAIERMTAGRQQAGTGNWFFGSVRSKELYRLPERFSTLL